MDFYGVEEKIRLRAPLDFGNLFSKTIELFKLVWMQGFITLLFNALSALVLLVILYIPLIALGLIDPVAFESQDPPTIYPLFVMLLMPIIFVCISAVSLLLMAGFYRVCKIKDENLTAAEGHFFYFKKKYIRKAFILALITIGFVIAGMLTCGFGLIYLGVPLALFPVFLAFDEELSAIEIVKASFALGNKNWLVLFGLLLLLGFIAQLGVLLCFVGIFFTAMLSRVSIYYAYKDGVGFKDETEDRLKSLMSDFE